MYFLRASFEALWMALGSKGAGKGAPWAGRMCLKDCKYLCFVKVTSFSKKLPPGRHLEATLTILYEIGAEMEVQNGACWSVFEVPKMRSDFWYTFGPILAGAGGRGGAHGGFKNLQREC